MLKCLLCWMRTSDGMCRWYRQNHHIPYYAMIPTVSLDNTCSYSRLPVCHIGPAGKLPANHESHYYYCRARKGPVDGSFHGLLWAKKELAKAGAGDRDSPR